jgi:hypothetical protein
MGGDEPAIGFGLPATPSTGRDREIATAAESLRRADVR